MFEQSKAARRRQHDYAFLTRYFVGNGIDVGCGQDSMKKTMNMFIQIDSITDFDRQHGDAQTMAGVEDNSFDFLHASHVLEHLIDPVSALESWLRVIIPGGHLIITVPDWEMYERQAWPSKFSNEHLHAFSLSKYVSGRYTNVVWYILFLIEKILPYIAIERLCVIRDHFDPKVMTDQTLGPAECAIEMVFRKHPSGGDR